MKLHIGGKKAHPDWKIVDIEQRPEVDFVGDARDLGQFADNSVEQIYASHVLEHFHYGVNNEVMTTLKEWHRVLQPGGQVLISVPDLHTLCWLYVSPNLDPNDRYHLMRIMFGGHMNEFDVHRVGFSAESLVSFLQDAGFENVLQVGKFDLFEDSSLVAFQGQFVSLNMIATKSTASVIQEIDRNPSASVSNQPVTGRIIVDGVFFQLYETGIGRLWQALLVEWSKSDFSNNILVLDRHNTSPRIAGINYRVVPLCKYDDLEAEQRLLQNICDEENADLFISTYYTRPLSTRSIFMGYDMIPEVLGADFSKPIWQAKHDAIRQAIAHITISQNTARDLQQYFPEVGIENVTPILCGVSDHFRPASEAEIVEFRSRYNIQKPYFLLVAPQFSYKNSQLFLEGLSHLSSRCGFDVVCTGRSAIDFSEEAHRQLPDILFHPLYLDDDELRLAYAGAVALVYPSLYEGFGLPVLEALKCGCPVITTANASIPEVAGEAAIYVGDRDGAAMAEALVRVQSPQSRQRLIQSGYQQAQKFSWASMAEKMKTTLSSYLPPVTPAPQVIVLVDWTQPEEALYEQLVMFFQMIDSVSASYSFLFETLGTDAESASMMLGGVLMDYLMTAETSMAGEPMIQFIDPLTLENCQNLNLSARIVLGEVAPQYAQLLAFIPDFGFC
jgi:predicted SAM-dependent methyltransferase/glycosyltransferase involved in cell wall biosynthesis